MLHHAQHTAGLQDSICIRECGREESALACVFEIRQVVQCPNHQNDVRRFCEHFWHRTKVKRTLDRGTIVTGPLDRVHCKRRGPLAANLTKDKGEARARSRPAGLNPKPGRPGGAGALVIANAIYWLSSNSLLKTNTCAHTHEARTLVLLDLAVVGIEFFVVVRRVL